MTPAQVLAWGRMGTACNAGYALCVVGFDSEYAGFVDWQLACFDALCVDGGFGFFNRFCYYVSAKKGLQGVQQEQIYKLQSTLDLGLLPLTVTGIDAFVQPAVWHLLLVCVLLKE